MPRLGEREAVLNHYNRDEIRLPIELRHFKEREKKWLWGHLISQGCNLPPQSNVLHESRESLLANSINLARDPKSLINEIIRTTKARFIDLKSFNWIKDDKRSTIWFFYYLLKFGFNLPNISMIPKSIIYHEIVYAFDNWDTSAEEKVKFIHIATQTWSSERTPDSQIKWIAPTNHQQLTWGWTYLLKISRAQLAINPVSADDQYSGILASLDQLTPQIMHPAEKNELIRKMHKTWTQKVYRESDSAKKPYNMPLKKTTIDMLEKIAALENIKPQDVVEALIRDAYALHDGKSYPSPNSR